MLSLAYFDHCVIIKRMLLEFGILLLCAEHVDDKVDLIVDA